MPDNDIPRLRAIPELPTLDVMGLAELKGFLDYSTGSAQRSTLAINLMMQTAPLLASMACLMKILKFVKALGPPPDPIKLAEAGTELADCFTIVAGPAKVALMIKDILALVITYFAGFVDQLESLVRFQKGIDLAAAAGNPVLERSLEQARDNAQRSLDHLMLSLGAVGSLLAMTKSVGDVVGIPLALPELSEISNAADPTAALQRLKAVVATLQNVIDTL